HREQGDAPDGQPHLVRRERRHGGGDGDRAGGDAHGHGQHVVGEDGGGGDQAGDRPKVLPGDDVGAASPRVRPDGLPVGRDHHGQQPGDGQAERDHQRQGGGPGGHQHQHHLLGGVGDRRQRVGGEDREGQVLGQELVLQLV